MPFYIFYSMFGMQRIGDLAWAAADQRARGFLLGATAGRTTLNGEGLQHEDGHSHLLSSVIPNCVSYDPTYGYEVAVIVQDGLRRMVDEPGGRLLLHHPDERELRASGDAEGRRAGHPQGDVPAAGNRKPKHKPRVQLLGSGTILREVLAAAELLEKDWGVAADVWSATSFTELRRDGLAAERWNLLHPEGKPRSAPTSSRCWRSDRGPGDRGERLHEDLRRPDPARSCRKDRVYRVLGTDGFGRSDSRAKLRHFFEVNRYFVVDRRAEGARRPGRRQGEGGRRRDQEVRHRSREGGSRPTV